MFKNKFNPDGSMYQLDGGAVIKVLLAHSTYLKELGVVVNPPSAYWPPIYIYWRPICVGVL